MWIKVSERPETTVPDQRHRRCHQPEPPRFNVREAEYLQVKETGSPDQPP